VNPTDLLAKGNPYAIGNLHLHRCALSSFRLPGALRLSAKRAKSCAPRATACRWNTERTWPPLATPFNRGQGRRSKRRPLLPWQESRPRLLRIAAGADPFRIHNAHYCHGASRGFFIRSAFFRGFTPAAAGGGPSENASSVNDAAHSSKRRGVVNTEAISPELPGTKSISFLAARLSSRRAVGALGKRGARL
jgi:hypothetical protein